MAANKKSVLLYCDIIHTVSKLDNETAGLLFKHYLEYINDMDPEPENMIIEIAFEPIKQNLKRDLKKWEIRARNSRLNGVKGGRPIGVFEKSFPKLNPKSHFVYLIYHTESGHYKIGETMNLDNRLYSMKKPISEIIVVHYIQSDAASCRRTEKLVIKQQIDNRIKGDWLYLEGQDVKDVMSLMDDTHRTHWDNEIPTKPVNVTVTDTVKGIVSVTDIKENKERVSQAIVIKEIFEYYNECVKGCDLPKAIKLTDVRRTHLAIRLKENSEAIVRDVIKKACKSQFLNGKGKSTFKASFDWIIKSASFQKILEGNYDDKGESENVFDKLKRQADERETSD